MEDAARAARRMWTLFEPVHVVTYFCAEALSAFTGAGLRGFWRGYFAGRAAPLGRVGPAPVTASFFNFAPSMVARALPGVWELITPEDALAVRSAGAVSALRRLLDGEMRSAIAAAIAALPANQAEVMTLRDVEGWSADEVCAALGISEVNQRVILHRARAKVRAALERLFPEGSV